MSNETKKTMIELHLLKGDATFYLDISVIKSVGPDDNGDTQIISDVSRVVDKIRSKRELFSNETLTEYKYKTIERFTMVSESVDEVMELLLKADTDIVDFNQK